MDRCIEWNIGVPRVEYRCTKECQEKYRWASSHTWVDATLWAKVYIVIVVLLCTIYTILCVYVDMSVDSSMSLRVLVSCLTRTITSQFAGIGIL